LTVYLQVDFSVTRLPARIFTALNKSDLRHQIIARLQADLELQTSAAQLARDEAISEESRAENKYDTHSQEAAYLAEGQAKLAAEVLAAIAIYQNLALPEFDASMPISLGAVVELAARGTSSWYFIGPRAGGLELTLAGHTILLVTPHSPIGRLLIGRKVGDTIVPPGRGAPTAHRILAVH